MAKSANKRAVLAKIESVYGTDPTPTGNANAMRVNNLNVTALNAERLKRDYAQPYFSNFEDIVVNGHVRAEFEVELQGSGTAGTAPAFGPLLRACALGETIVANTSVTYAPVSASFESVTMYFYVDGIVQKVKGMRGDCVLALNARAVPVLRFSMTGIYAGPIDGALPSVNVTAFKAPVAAEKTNTSGFSLMGVTSFAMESLTVNFANEVLYRNLVGAEQVMIQDRRPNGEVVIDYPAVATYDFFAAAIAGTTGALAIQHGQSAGYIATITCGKIQPLEPAQENTNGSLMLKIPFNILPTSGNDDFSIAFT